ncbi:hypothetical protein HRI_005189100 [Hibiscus trionum]|uniref:VQ domain-containing protein n=1 Tax=Hibiscus trionum TaxID=183268 RepID=A0A9W7JKI0_HIBTR|nr:hypothetical protein HRI_005189100 [Hibiscus trionum]
MDSGNSSSSLQSSSGDDEEYDSRHESVPAFLNTSGHFSGLSYPPSSLGSHQHHQPPTFFDPSPNYLNNTFSQSQLLNLDGVRPRSLRSDPYCTDLGNLPGQGLNRDSFPSSSSIQTRPPHDNNGVRSSTKNPKKRTRASRRAPTTVLATDTTNFRAMVQEFTGIPAPPFTGSSPYSRRLDLFGSGSGIRSGHFEALYPLRPSAKRVQPIANTTIPSNYQLPSDLSLVKQPQNMLDLQNQSPVLPFQSFLDPTPLPPWVNMPGFGVKSHGSSAPSLDELGLSHGQVNAELGGQGNRRDGVGLNQYHLRGLDWNYGNSGSNPHEKGLENASSRAEEQLHKF